MTAKQIQIKNRMNKPKSASVDEWVSTREGMQRFTLDLPANLHTQLKIEAAKTNMKMGEIIKQCLEDKFGEASR